VNDETDKSLSPWSGDGGTADEMALACGEGAGVVVDGEALGLRGGGLFFHCFLFLGLLNSFDAAKLSAVGTILPYT